MQSPSGMRPFGKNILRWIHFSAAETFVAEFPKKVSMALILIHNLKH